MPKLIEDKYTDLPISRQRRYQLRKKALNVCQQCGQPSEGNARCLACTILYREFSRRYYGYAPKEEGKRGRPIERR